MLLTALLLSTALVPQEAQAAPAQKPAAQAQAPAEKAAPAPQPKATGETEAAKPAGDKPAGEAAAPKAEVSGPIEEGLTAFKRHHFAAAKAAFEKAEEADPQSAAAAFYLGYTYYKLGEPSHRMNANKEKAKELFAKAFSLDPSFKPVWVGRTK
jgi:tetratricopeptide (TPR) repeat protein